MKKCLTTVCASVFIASMKRDLNLAQKVKALKVGQHFLVDSEKQRQAASRIAKSLRDAGVIEFQVVTKRWYDGKFKVCAI